MLTWQVQTLLRAHIQRKVNELRMPDFIHGIEVGILSHRQHFSRSMLETFFADIASADAQ